jgi:hypothetical protein
MEEDRKPLTQLVVVGLAIVAVIAVAIGGYYWYSHRSEAALPVALPAPAPAPVVAPPPPAPAASPYAHPIDDTAADHATPLDQSDAAFLAALAHVDGWRPSVLHLLLPTNLIRHIVATVDALPRQKLPLQANPVKAVPGSLGVTTTDKGIFISTANALRYKLTIEAFLALDTAQLVATYRHFYPLFQQAYRELGYPTGYFNDRLVAVIDDLLEAPEPKAPIPVVAPGAMFRYVDPDLESLPAGQKILVRMGASNETPVKTKLRDLRQAVTTP